MHSEIVFQQFDGDVTIYDGAEPDKEHLLFSTKALSNGRQTVVSMQGRILMTGYVRNGTMTIGLKEICDRTVYIAPDVMELLFNPYYPNNIRLLKYLKCTWTIVAPSGYHIQGNVAMIYRKTIFSAIML